MKTREELQGIWEQIVQIGFSNYEQLNMSQKIWFNVESLAVGGITDHYLNYGADKNAETIECLDLLGLMNLSKMLNEINNLFEKKSPSKNIEERNKEISSWDERKTRILERNENIFWDNIGDLEKVLLDFLNKKLEEISSFR